MVRQWAIITEFMSATSCNAFKLLKWTKMIVLSFWIAKNHPFFAVKKLFLLCHPSFGKRKPPQHSG